MSELAPNGSFVPGTSLQWAIDSTSIGAMKTCWRKYQLGIIEGWQPRQRSEDLSFGIWLHESRERYYHARARGEGHEDALTLALTYALEATFDHALGRPWTSANVNKNRLTLVRTLVWYLDQWRDDPLEQVYLADGRPAVELTFKFETDYHHATGPFVLCGHLDRLVRLGDVPYGSDLKTTKSTLGQAYFAQFSPDNQMSLYSLAMKSVYAQPVRGIIVDAAQVAVTFSRFERGIIARSADQLDEWYRDLGEYLRQAQDYAKHEYWPMNDKACFRCEFRSICARPASTREQWLQADYTRRTWDPTQARGDI